MPCFAAGRWSARDERRERGCGAIVDKRSEGHEPVPAGEERCEYCGAAVREATVQMAFWEGGGEKLVMVTGVPARVCVECHEQYFSDEVRVRIDRLRTGGFGARQPVRIVQVPVFSFDDIATPGPGRVLPGPQDGA